MKRHLSTFADALTPPEPPAAIERLTGHEWEVLLLLSRALSNAEIARRLRVGDATVKTHISNILRKLELRDRTHAVAYAHLTGFASRP